MIGSVIRIVSWVRCSGFFSGSPSSDRGSSWPRVEDLSRVWIASTVSQIDLPCASTFSDYWIISPYVCCGCCCFLWPPKESELVNQICFAEFLFLVNWVAAVPWILLRLFILPCRGVQKGLEIWFLLRIALILVVCCATYHFVEERFATEICTVKDWDNYSDILSVSLSGRPQLTWDESVKRDLKDWDISEELALDRSARS